MNSQPLLLKNIQAPSKFEQMEAQESSPLLPLFREGLAMSFGDKDSQAVCTLFWQVFLKEKESEQPIVEKRRRFIACLDEIGISADSWGEFHADMEFTPYAAAPMMSRGAVEVTTFLVESVDKLRYGTACLLAASLLGRRAPR